MKHDYGINDHRIFCGGNDASWQLREAVRKVTLVNVADCQNKLTVEGTHRLFMGMGKMEWEVRQAMWLVEAVVAALNENEEVADISKMFNHDMLGWWSREEETPYVKKAEDVSDFLLEKLFEVVEDTPEELRVKIVNIA